VGDIIQMTEGYEIPIDGMIVECHDLTIGETRMTSESNSVNVSSNKTNICMKKDDQYYHGRYDLVPLSYCLEPT